MRKRILIVMFDLPMTTKQEQKSYRNFIKKLKSEGFVMLQKSIYAKCIRGKEALNVYETKVRSYADEGSIFLLPVGYKSFCRMTNFAGKDYDFLCNSIIVI